MLDVAIVGGGLSGLSLARGLLAQGRQPMLFEARDRHGGRILSQPTEAGFRYDLGPGWMWPQFQPRLARLIQQHRLQVYPQWIDGHSLYQTSRKEAARPYLDHDSYGSARRLEGGTHCLIEALLMEVPEAHWVLEHRLRELVDQGKYIELLFDGPGGEVNIQARQVVLTIPPRLLAESVRFHPELDGKLSAVMQDTATWMAGHAKVVVRYAEPFWRRAGLSGSALAAHGEAALGEVFDAGAEDGGQAALSGFMALPAALRQKYHDDLEPLVLAQLIQLFGDQAAQAEAFLIKDWFEDGYTATEDDRVLPSAHPQYGHRWLQLAHWNDKLYFSGTETAPEFGGFLEGALESAQRVLKDIQV